MAFTTFASGLQLVIPTNGTTNWGTTLKNSTWTKINGHMHTGTPDGNKMVKASLTNNIVDQDIISKNLAVFQGPALNPAGAAQTIDFDTGNKQILNLGAASGTVTLTLDNPIQGGEYRVKVVQGATARLLIWPANVKWPGGEEPSQFQLLNSDNVVYLDYDGTDFIGRWELAYA